MAFREQTLKDISGFEAIARIPSTAFANPAVPLDAEVKLWAQLHISEEDLIGTYLVYDTVDGSDSNYKYAWYCIKIKGSPIELVRLKDVLASLGVSTLSVNNVPLNREPTPSGNVSDLNSVVISDDGQHWIIDQNGVAVNINKSTGDFEITDQNKGVVFVDENGDRYRIKIIDGITHREKL